MNSNNRILTIYKSRKTILDQLEYLGYDISMYKKFNINEVDSMISNTTLNMVVENKNNVKVYIRYSLQTKNQSKQLRPENLASIVEELEITKEDILIIIIEDEPNETLINALKYMYEQNGIFVVVHNINRLQYNILEHVLVPNCTVLNNKEVEELKKKYNIQNLSQLPEISRFDPQALVNCIRPGQVCKFQRNSDTAMITDTYKVCVQ